MWVAPTNKKAAMCLSVGDITDWQLNLENIIAAIKQRNAIIDYLNRD